MADHTITIGESLNLLGPQDTSRWGTLIWGVGTWGLSIEDYREDIMHVANQPVVFSESLAHREVVSYLPSETFSIGDDYIKSTVRVLGTDSLVIDDDFIKSTARSVNFGTISTALENSDLYMTLGIYYHQFISEVADADDRSHETFTQTTHASDTYSKDTNPVTPWS